jgi:hypothetical protein
MPGVNVATECGAIALRSLWMMGTGTSKEGHKEPCSISIGSFRGAIVEFTGNTSSLRLSQMSPNLRTPWVPPSGRAIVGVSPRGLDMCVRDCCQAAW